jgi:hypothetical protein
MQGENQQRDRHGKLCGADTIARSARETTFGDRAVKDWTLKEWVIFYAAVVSTAAMLWHFANLWRLWRDRDSVELRIDPTWYTPNDGPTIQWLDLHVRNAAPNPIFIERIDVKRRRSRGFLMYECRSPFPCEIEPFREVKVGRLPLDMFLDDPKSMAVVDGRKRRWKLKKKQLIKAIDTARKIKAEYDSIGLNERTMDERLNFKGFKDLKRPTEKG